MRLVLCALLSVTLAACAARGGRQATTPGPTDDTTGSTAPGPDPRIEPPETLLERVQRAREARPERVPVATIEGQDSRLSTALLAATARQSPETLRAVAHEYSRLRVADRAHDYLDKALALDRRDGATYDALARLWRDLGSLSPALGHAYRAVYFAPASPAARNTLGTVLQAIGLREGAREQYERALALDPTATYALNNVCYGWILEGDAPKATRACERALSVDPSLIAARNNLGILHAARGDLEGARAAFAQSGDPSVVFYNLGIIHLARREYRQAAESFAAAQRASPTKRTAARVRQALALSTAGGNQ